MIDEDFTGMGQLPPCGIYLGGVRNQLFDDHGDRRKVEADMECFPRLAWCGSETNADAKRSCVC